MSGKRGTLADAEDRFVEELAEPGKALSLSDYYARSFPYKDENTRQDGTTAGRKKRNRVNGAIKALPGKQTLDTDANIRAIVALRYQNCKYPEAFDAAEADMVALVMRDYYRNVNIIRGALGWGGHIALETLLSLMQDKEAKAEVRLRAAKAVLDQLDVVGGPRSEKGAAAVVEAVGGVVKDAYEMGRNTERDSTIVTLEIESELEETGEN